MTRSRTDKILLFLAKQAKLGVLNEALAWFEYNPANKTYSDAGFCITEEMVNDIKRDPDHYIKMLAND